MSSLCTYKYDLYINTPIVVYNFLYYFFKYVILSVKLKKNRYKYSIRIEIR